MAQSRIPLFYRIFFLYIDPLLCLSGIYLCFFDHATYIVHGIPAALSTSIPSDAPLTPLETHLLRALGAWGLSIFAIQVLLLQQFKNAPDGVNVQVWRIVMVSILLTDLALVYGTYLVDPKSFVDVASWGSGDWTTNGVLAGVIAIRSAFLLGIGGVGKGI